MLLLLLLFAILIYVGLHRCGHEQKLMDTLAELGFGSTPFIILKTSVIPL